MNLPQEAKSKLAVSIGMAKSPASSTTGGVSGCEPSGDWLRVGTWRFQFDRIVAVGRTNTTLDLWFDIGMIVELTLRSGVEDSQAIEAILKKKDLTGFVQSVFVKHL